MEHVLPPDSLLVHYLDDFRLVHHDTGYLRRHIVGAVLALELQVFIVSRKSVLEPSTRLVFLGKWFDLLQRMMWFHEVAHVQLFVVWLFLAV